MVEKTTTFALLQVVALVLPAAAIYLEILTSRHDLSNMDDGIAANYHAIRLTFIYLLLAGVALILSLYFPLLEYLLIGIAITGLVLGLLTFSLPVVFSKIGLSDSRSIIWPYMNTIHRLRDSLPDSK